MIYASIWEDVVYTVTGVTSVDYYIFKGEELVYAGKAVARPSMASCNINVSRIVQNYLNSELPNSAFNNMDFNTGSFYLENATGQFTLTDGKGNVFETYKFLNCWDYKTPYAIMGNSSMNYPISYPINDHYTNGMYSFTSLVRKANKNVSVQITDVIGDYCGYGALYYSNRCGGWDSFLIENPIVKKESFEKYTIDKKWKAGTLESGSKTLMNTITESWTLKTHLLNDNESNLIATHLYSSNNIYFHSFEDNKIRPVSITDTSVDYKTRLNQKKKMYYHTINIIDNQPKQRI